MAVSRNDDVRKYMKVPFSTQCLPSTSAPLHSFTFISGTIMSVLPRVLGKLIEREEELWKSEP